MTKLTNKRDIAYKAMYFGDGNTIWLRPSQCRCVVLIVSSSKSRYKLNAAAEFAGLEEGAKEQLIRQLEYWRDNPHHTIKQWYHGWETSKYRECYVLKYKAHRFYGFLHKPTFNNRYVVWAITTHGRKHKKDTDLKLLDEVVKIRDDNEIKLAISKFEGGLGNLIER